MSTHADPSNSSQMQLETPGGVGVSCPCERRAMVEFKPKTDTGLCVAKWPACNQYTSPFPQLIPQNVTHHILIWNDHPQPGERKGENTAEVWFSLFKKRKTKKGEIWPAKSRKQSNCEAIVVEAKGLGCDADPCPETTSDGKDSMSLVTRNRSKVTRSAIAQHGYCVVSISSWSGLTLQSVINDDLDSLSEGSESQCAMCHEGRKHRLGSARLPSGWTEWAGGVMQLNELEWRRRKPLTECCKSETPLLDCSHWQAL